MKSGLWTLSRWNDQQENENAIKINIPYKDGSAYTYNARNLFMKKIIRIAYQIGIK